MVNSVKLVHKWNADAGLLDKDDRWLESYMLLEELFEGMGIPEPKHEAKAFIEAVKQRKNLKEVNDVEWLDHLCDIEFILHGSKAKMGLTPQQDNASIMAVYTANLQKLKAGKDSAGKQVKPVGFKGPEEALQKILNKVN